MADQDTQRRHRCPQTLVQAQHDQSLKDSVDMDRKSNLIHAHNAHLLMPTGPQPRRFCSKGQVHVVHHRLQTRTGTYLPWADSGAGACGRLRTLQRSAGGGAGYSKVTRAFRSPLAQRTTRNSNAHCTEPGRGAAGHLLVRRPHRHHSTSIDGTADMRLPATARTAQVQLCV